MPLRDILVTVIVIGTLPFIFRRPYIGVLVWSWLSYMNPHRLTWSFAYDLPFAQIVAITLLISLLLNRDKKSIPINGITILWMIFILWMTITTIFAVYPDKAFEYYIRVMKIQIMTFITLMLITDQRKINLLLWTIALSIGFYSIKGGLFTIITGGAYRVYGPPQTMFGENNTLALATMMIIPLFYYLYSLPNPKWVKWFLLLAMGLSFVSVLGSQSRGAFLAIGCVLAYFWWVSKTKVLTAPLIIAVALLGFAFMPEGWHDRMASIKNYQEDSSAMSRLHAWKYSINIANDRVSGGGFSSWSPETYNKYSSEYTGVYVAHSNYFNVLADHGWLGLIFYLLIFWLTWRSLSNLVKQTNSVASEKELNTLARMMKVGLVAYLSAGAFLSMSYFDLAWHYVAITVLLKMQYQQRLKTTGPNKVSSSKQSLVYRKRNEFKAWADDELPS